MLLENPFKGLFRNYHEGWKIWWKNIILLFVKAHKRNFVQELFKRGKCHDIFSFKFRDIFHCYGTHSVLGDNNQEKQTSSYPVKARPEKVCRDADSEQPSSERRHVIYYDSITWMLTTATNYILITSTYPVIVKVCWICLSVQWDTFSFTLFASLPGLSGQGLLQQNNRKYVSNSFSNLGWNWIGGKPVNKQTSNNV